MRRPLTTLLLLIAIVAGAVLRLHHCHGAIGARCATHATVGSLEAAGPRVCSVLGGLDRHVHASCTHACDDSAPEDRTDSSLPDHAPSPCHGHLGCVDAVVDASAARGSALTSSLDFAPIDQLRIEAVGVQLPQDTAAHSPSCERGDRIAGAPPPGLRSTRLLI